MSRRLIVAPAAAGKSTFIKNHPSPRFIDGDDIIKAAGGFDWSPGHEIETREKIAVTLKEYVRDHPDMIVFFNGDVNRWPELVSSAVLLPYSVMHEQMVSRHDANAAAGKQDLGYPHHAGQILENMLLYCNAARDYGFPIVSSFEAAVQLIDSEETSHLQPPKPGTSS